MRSASFLSLPFALLLIACGGGGGSSPAPNAGGQGSTLSSITLAPTAPALNVGMAVDLQATGHYSDGSTGFVDSEVIWTSSSPSVATVNASGLVTGLAAGSASITATKGTLQATAAVSVSTSTTTLSSISLNPISGTLTVGHTLDITATANWSNGTSTVPYDSSVAWTSSNTGVATVNAGGVVTALGSGSATITASASGHSATCAITVQPGPAAALTSISLTPTSATLAVGATVDLAATAHWSDGTSTSPYDSQVTWTTSAASVATVNAAGLVTAMGSGNATITATKGGIQGTAPITVTSSTPTFDPRLLGRWKWIGVPDANGANYGSFYVFNANGTFSYSLIYQGGGGCISYQQVVAYHEGTFSTQGPLDNPASPGKIILTCSLHHTDWTTCSGSTSRTAWTGTNPHFHWAAFSSGTLLTNHADDFTNTGSLQHIAY